MARSGRDVISQAFTVSNWNEDLSLDCDALQFSGSAVVSADVLGTLINELIKQGIISGTVAA